MSRLSTHSSSGHTILVVDDNPLVLESLRYLFEREGHTVLIADNGRSALEICQTSAVHVMVLDFNMPGLTGGETVEKLREFNTDTQVILQTGQSLIPAREMLRELEIQGYHDKSEGAEKLMLWVDAALKSYRQAHTQKPWKAVSWHSAWHSRCATWKPPVTRSMLFGTQPRSVRLLV